MKYSLLLIFLISTTIYGQTHHDLTSSNKSYWMLKEKIRKEDEDKRGCLTIFSQSFNSKAEESIQRLYSKMYFNKYKSKKVFIREYDQPYNSFKKEITPLIIDHFESCTKMDILILGHGNDLNNSTIPDIFEVNGKSGLLHKARLVFSSGCGDAADREQVERWLLYANTFVASKEINMATATLIFMRKWRKGLKAIDALKAANESIWGNNPMVNKPEDDPELTLFGESDINIFSH